MIKKNKFISILILLIIFGAVVVNLFKFKDEDISKTEQAFAESGLKTNTAIRSVELNEILSGGPPKDGIPAITNPKFISIEKAFMVEDLEDLGISVEINGESRFYPYSILVWHEIVNDKIAEHNILVTFCPLCGSAIVFDPKIEGEVRIFGVSGKLWESNLLMYDDVNESLWSQSIGEAIAGDDTGKKLNLLPSQLLTLRQFAENNPEGVVLSRNTGFKRNYGSVVYPGYNNNDSTFFDISIRDTRFHPKKIMYIINFGDQSIAFGREELVNEGRAEINILDELIKVEVREGEIVVTDSSDKIIPGYHEMWFSWAIHHQDNGIVWKK